MGLCVVGAVLGLALAWPHPALAVAIDGCDWGTSVLDPIVSVYGPLGGFDRCGIEALENDAYNLYASAHGMAAGDPRITQDGQYEIAGILWALLQGIAHAHATNASALTADQQGAYNWLHTIVTSNRKQAAEDALAEYNRWKASPCSFQPPGQHLFTWNPFADPGCSPSFASLAQAPSPPSYEQLLEMGQYDEEHTQGVNVAGSAYQQLETELISEAGVTFSSALLSSVPGLLRGTGFFGKFLTEFAAKVNPSAKQTVFRALKRVLRNGSEKAVELAQKLKVAQRAGQLSKAGEVLDDVIEPVVNNAIQEGATAGLDIGDAVAEIGATSLTGPFFVAGFALDVLVQESINIANQLQLPGQLQANIDAANADIDKLISGTGDGGGYPAVFQDFISQLTISAPPVGTPGHVVSTPPDDGSRFEVSLANSNGDTVYTSDEARVPLVTWPLGIDQGAYGPGFSQFALAHGQVWRQVGSDPRFDDYAAAGLSGWVPSGELRYFDWSGHPRIALVAGDHFLDFSAPGSVDVGGADIGGLCAGGNAECNQTNTIFALEFAHKANTSTTQNVLNNDGTITQEVVPSHFDGTVVPEQRVRLTLKPDPGAQPLIYIENQWGQAASTTNNPSQFEGGLFAGDRVHFVDLEDNPLGYTTTYTWKIESRCAYQQSCTPDTDPAFHGNPTVTLTGKGVDYTWPSPGTYHVRLTTTDQYGATQVSDQDVTVDGVNPMVALGSSTGFAGASVFGPVDNGSQQQITGCIDDPANPYANPHVTIDWGDGTPSDSASGRSSTDPNLTFNYGTTASCPHLWQFTAKHTYNVSNPNNVFQLQKPMQITVNNGLGGTYAVDLGVDIQFVAPPAFSSATSVNFTAGTFTDFRVVAGGSPRAAVSIKTGTLPPGIGFVADNTTGTATISGSANPANAGAWPVTLEASNGQGPPVDQSFTLNVNVTPAITSSSATTVQLDHSSTVNITTSGTPNASVTISGAAPPGMQVVDGANSGTGSITGTPTALGVYPLTVEADNAAGSATQELTLTVGSAPAFTSGTSAGFITNASAPSGFDITTSGFPTPSISCQSPCTLPSGLNFGVNGDGTAEIYGTATVSTTDQVTLTATNSAGSSMQTVTVTSSATGGPIVGVTAGATFDSNKGFWIAPMNEGSAATVDISSAPANNVALSEIGGLPSGMTFTDNGNGTASITGTPATGTGGFYGLVIKSHPSSGPPDGLAFVELEVEGPPTMTSGPTAVFTVGHAGDTFKVTTSGLPRAGVSTTDTLPHGLTFDGSANDGTATISGTPQPDAVGTTTIHVAMENLINFGHPTTVPLKIVVQQAPSITSAQTVGFGEAQADSFNVTTTGYPAPTLQVAGGTLPPGIKFTDNGDGTGSFSGTPSDTTTTSYKVTVQASNAAGTITQELTFNLGFAPDVIAAGTTTFTVGNNQSFPIVSSAKPRPTFMATGLPPGLSLTDNGDGTAMIHGTPQAGSGGDYPVAITATNTYGATTKTVALTVDQAAAFAGTQTGLTCASSDPTINSENFLGPSGWTLCATGHPTPHLTLAGQLPAGITFTDNGDGSAQISGNAGTGGGGAHPLTLLISNAAGTVTEPLTLNVDLPVDQTTKDSTTFVAGQANSYTISATGFPLPAFSTLSGPGCGAPPSWLRLADDHNGSATFTGNPPDSAIGQVFPVQVDEEQGVGNGARPCVDITVAPLAFTADAPASPTAGVPYSYTFTSTDPSATWSVAAGGTLPAGLTLSRSGKLSGTPTTVGAFAFRVIATDTKGSVTSDPITATVKSARHQLEIRAFRVYGPAGTGDWFVTVRNTTGITMPLYGWKVAMFLPRLRHPIMVPFRARLLAPRRDATVAGPFFSLSRSIGVAVIGPAVSAIPGGFEVLAPDGRVTDRAGEVGAPKATIAGTAVPVPKGRAFIAQDAFERRGSHGVLIDTNNNRHDFTYVSLALKQTIRFTSKPPRRAIVGGHYRVSARGGRSGKPVVFKIARRSTKGACTLRRAVITFTGIGVCVIEANQAGSLTYLHARAVFQSVLVHRR